MTRRDAARHGVAGFSANKYEKMAGLQLCIQIKDNERGGKPLMVQMDSGNEEEHAKPEQVCAKPSNTINPMAAEASLRAPHRALPLAESQALPTCALIGLLAHKGWNPLRITALDGGQRSPALFGIGSAARYKTNCSWAKPSQPPRGPNERVPARTGARLRARARA